MSAPTAATVSEEEVEAAARAICSVLMRNADEMMPSWVAAEFQKPRWMSVIRDARAALEAAARVRAAPTPSPAPAGARVTEEMVEAAFFALYGEHGKGELVRRAIEAALGTAATPGGEPVALRLQTMLAEIKDAADGLLISLPGHWHDDATIRLTDAAEDAGKLISEIEQDALYAAPPTTARQTTPAEDARRVALEDRWQPIETAPKDRPILISDGSYVLRAYWDDKFDSDWDDQSEDVVYTGAWTDGTVANWGMEENNRYDPTFWQPLPAPPAALAEVSK